MGKKKKKKVGSTFLLGEDYREVNRKINREIELERNGGRWIAVDRPWKNKKAYDRKRDRKIDFSPASFLFSQSSSIVT